MVEDEISYFRHRAEVETERARQASVPEVVAVHRQLAEAYLGRLAGAGAAAAPSEAETR